MNKEAAENQKVQDTEGHPDLKQMFGGSVAK